MRLGDRGDDREPEAQAVGGTDPVGAAALERPDEPGDVIGRDHRARVGHRQHGAALSDPGGHLNRAVRDIVAHGIVDEVGHEPLGEPRIADSQRRIERRGDGQPALLGFGPPGQHHLASQGGEIDGLAAVKPALAAGQCEQRLDQPFLLFAGREQPRAQVPQPACRWLRVGKGDLDQRPLPGQRRAQLMRGVGDELPLGVERSLQPTQQPVERVAEFPELIARTGQREPGMQVARGDGPGRGRDRAKLAQHPARDQPAEPDRHQGHDRQRDTRLGQQLVQLERALLTQAPLRPRRQLRR